MKTDVRIGHESEPNRINFNMVALGSFFCDSKYDHIKVTDVESFNFDLERLEKHNFDEKVMVYSKADLKLKQ